MPNITSSTSVSPKLPFQSSVDRLINKSGWLSNRLSTSSLTAFDKHQPICLAHEKQKRSSSILTAALAWTNHERIVPYQFRFVAVMHFRVILSSSFSCARREPTAEELDTRSSILSRTQVELIHLVFDPGYVIVYSRLFIIRWHWSPRFCTVSLAYRERERARKWEGRKRNVIRFYLHDRRTQIGAVVRLASNTATKRERREV